MIIINLILLVLLIKYSLGFISKEKEKSKIKKEKLKEQLNQLVEMCTIVEKRKECPRNLTKCCLSCEYNGEDCVCDEIDFCEHAVWGGFENGKEKENVE